MSFLHIFSPPKSGNKTPSPHQTISLKFRNMLPCFYIKMLLHTYILCYKSLPGGVGWGWNEWICREQQAGYIQFCHPFYLFRGIWLWVLTATESEGFQNRKTPKICNILSLPRQKRNPKIMEWIIKKRIRGEISWGAKIRCNAGDSITLSAVKCFRIKSWNKRDLIFASMIYNVINPCICYGLPGRNEVATNNLIKIIFNFVSSFLFQGVENFNK